MNEARQNEHERNQGMNNCDTVTPPGLHLPKPMSEPTEQSTEPEVSEKKKRTARPGIRHRRDNGPAELEIEPIAPPKAQDIGTLTRWTQEILAGGPRALIAAEHKAGKLAKKFGIELEAQWCLSTPYIEQLSKSENARSAR